MDKTSVIRLSLAGLKCSEVVSNGEQLLLSTAPSLNSPPGLNIPSLKEESLLDKEIFSSLEGFTIVLGSDNTDIIFVTENVTNYIGLSQVRRSE